MKDWKWQWMSNSYGGMGWFSDEDKAALEGTVEFSDGYWRPLALEEVASFKRHIGRLAYDQA